jgi:hypothetical protein
MKRSGRYECLSSGSNLQSHHSLLRMPSKCHRCNYKLKSGVVFECFKCSYIYYHDVYVCTWWEWETTFRPRSWPTSNYAWECDCSKLQCLLLSSMRKSLTLRYVRCIFTSFLSFSSTCCKASLCFWFLEIFNVFIFLTKWYWCRYKLLITAYYRSSWNPRLLSHPCYICGCHVHWTYPKSVALSRCTFYVVCTLSCRTVTLINYICGSWFRFLS